MFGPSWLWSYGSWIYNYLCNQCLSPMKLWVRISIRARGTTLCDKVCQWLVTGRWFSLGTPVSSTNKTDCHDTTEVQGVYLRSVHWPVCCSVNICAVSYWGGRGGYLNDVNGAVFHPVWDSTNIYTTTDGSMNTS
jgi:hypothetical protein